MTSHDGPILLDPPAVRGLVFDLDGTLVDSYEAIAASLNHARLHFDLAPLDQATVRRAVGHGLESLIEQHVGGNRVEEGVRLFREHYATVYAPHTHALPGARDALRLLSESGYRLAVASNKPARFTAPILEHLDMARDVSSIQGPDVAGATKPHPNREGGCESAGDDADLGYRGGDRAARQCVECDRHLISFTDTRNQNLGYRNFHFQFRG